MNPGAGSGHPQFPVDRPVSRQPPALISINSDASGLTQSAANDPLDAAMTWSLRSTRSKICLALAVAALGLTSCAALDGVSTGERAQLREVAAGRALARSRCLACHQVQAPLVEGAAPPLTEVARRYRDARLDWELETIAEVGHYRMPRTPLSAAEIAALSAYIRSLQAEPDESPMRGRPARDPASPAGA